MAVFNITDPTKNGDGEQLFVEYVLLAVSRIGAGSARVSWLLITKTTVASLVKRVY